MQAVMEELSFAPGKSMRAYEEVDALHIGYPGVIGDREYMWVESEEHTNTLYFAAGKTACPGQFISQREDPGLTAIIPLLTPDGLVLNRHDPDDCLWVPRMDDSVHSRIPVSVWGWSGEAVDQGDEAADWGQYHIGRPVRLVAVSDEKPRFVEGDPALGRVGFADGYPITVGCTTSFRIINEYLASVGRPPMPGDRSRTTILLDGIPFEDPLAFPEDYIETITIAYDGLVAVLRRQKACGRCPIPDTDQKTGERKQHIRSALGKLGRSGTHLDTNRYGSGTELFYTQNFVIELPEDMPKDAVIPIRRGGLVEVTFSDSTNWLPNKKSAA
jgi:uncharacterized protein YcbX